ncbi:MAG: Uma2 family endonuclease [Symploca sp. SIO2E6]|nr:Uma2 family endonuclease [Symploca sp. SIO2E6]
MILAKSPKPTTIALPDHTQLPESDGTFVFAERAVGKNFQEHPQSVLLTYSIRPILQQLHPDGQYPWLRWWDNQGNLLLTGDERSQLLTSQLEQERQRAERLAEQLRQMGIDPDQM